MRNPVRQWVGRDRRQALRRAHVASCILTIAVLATPFGTQAADGASGQQANNQGRNVTADSTFLVGPWAGIRRALLSVLGVVSSPNQLDKDKKNSALVRQYYTDQNDLKFFEQTGAAMAYLPQRLESPSPSTGGGNAGAGGAGPCDVIRDLDQFLSDCAATTRQVGVGRLALLREALTSVATAQTDVSRTTYTGGQGIQPQYLGEQGASGQSGTSGSPQTEGAQTSQVLAAATGGASAPWVVTIPQGLALRAAQSALSEAPPLKAVQTSGSLQDRVTGTDINQGTSTNEQREPQTCITEPNGQQRCLVTTPEHSLSSHTSPAGGGGCATCGATGGIPGAGGSSGLGGVLGGFGNFFGGSVPGLAQNFFGQDFSRFQNMLGPNRFFQLAQGLLGGSGGAGGGGGGGRPPPTPRVAPVQERESCTAANARLSSAQAVSLTQLLGMNADLGPWTPSYRPTASLVGLDALNAETDQDIILRAEDFRPQDTCAWVISGQARQGFREVVIVSDTEDPDGREFRLVVSESTVP